MMKKRILRVCLIVFAIPVLFYGIENLRGSLALKRYIADCRANGEWFEEHERVASRKTGRVNLLGIAKAENALKYPGLFDFDQVGFDRIKVVNQKGFVLCEPFEFDQVWADSESGSRNSSASLYLELTQKINSDLNDFCSALDQTDEIYFSFDGLEMESLPFDYLMALQSTSRALRYRASARLQVGQVDKALSDVIAVCQLSRYLFDSDILINQLMATGIQHEISHTIWEGLESRSWSESQCWKLSEALLIENKSIDIPFEIFMTERAMALIHLREADSVYKRYRQMFDVHPVSEGMVALTSLVGEPTRSDKVKAWLGKWHYVLLPDGWLKLWFIHKIEAFRKSHFITSAAPSIPLTYSIWGTSGSDYSNIDTSRKQYFALRNLVAIAAANEAHFLRNGRYADQLTELVPELMAAVPRDPYSGNEFIYFKSGERSNRPVIYSVDQNLTDDGGYRFLKKRMGDLVWQYELPKNFTKEHYLHSKFPRSVID